MSRSYGEQNKTLFLFPPTSFKHEFYGVTSGFTRLIMKTKYVCHGLISLHVIFYDNRTKGTETLNTKICRWGGGGGGGGGKRAQNNPQNYNEQSKKCSIADNALFH